MRAHDYQSVLSPLDSVPLICSREVCCHECHEIASRMTLRESQKRNCSSHFDTCWFHRFHLQFAMLNYLLSSVLSTLFIQWTGPIWASFSGLKFVTSMWGIKKLVEIILCIIWCTIMFVCIGMYFQQELREDINVIVFGLVRPGSPHLPCWCRTFPPQINS